MRVKETDRIAAVVVGNKLGT